MEPATENHPYYSFAVGGDGGGSNPLLTGIRHRLSRDMMLRHAEARRRAAEAYAAVAGGHWDWDDDGEPVYSDPASTKAMLAMRVPRLGETREKSCAVCLDDFVADGRKLRMMPCSHSFHQSCIVDWLFINRICPVCHFKMPPQSADGEREVGAGD